MTIARREFVTGMTAAGAAGLLRLHPKSAAAEPPPETTTIRLSHSPMPVSPPYSWLSLSSTPRDLAAWSMFPSEGR